MDYIYEAMGHTVEKCVIETVLAEMEGDVEKTVCELWSRAAVIEAAAASPTTQKTAPKKDQWEILWSMVDQDQVKFVEWLTCESNSITHPLQHLQEIFPNVEMEAIQNIYEHCNFDTDLSARTIMLDQEEKAATETTQTPSYAQIVKSAAASSSLSNDARQQSHHSFINSYDESDTIKNLCEQHADINPQTFYLNDGDIDSTESMIEGIEFVINEEEEEQHSDNFKTVSYKKRRKEDDAVELPASEFVQFRKQAIVHRNELQRLYSVLQTKRLIQDKRLIRQQIQKVRSEITAAHESAAYAVFNTCIKANENVIDFHGLIVKEALVVTRLILRHCKKKHKTKFTIICGTGNHSTIFRGARLLPVIQAYLAKDRSCSFTVDDGKIMIKFKY